MEYFKLLVIAVFEAAMWTLIVMILIWLIGSPLTKEKVEQEIKGKWKDI